MNKTYTLEEAAKIFDIPRPALVVAIVSGVIEAVPKVMGNRIVPRYTITAEQAKKFKEMRENDTPYAVFQTKDKSERKRRSTDEDLQNAAARKRLEMMREARQIGMSPEELGWRLPNKEEAATGKREPRGGLEVPAEAEGGWLEGTPFGEDED